MHAGRVAFHAAKGGFLIALGTMPVSPMSDPDTSGLARRILLGQASVSAVLAVLGGAMFGVRAGLWVLAGGAIGTIANLYMTLAALRSVGGNAGLALRRLFTGQFVKVGLTVLLFYAAARRGNVVWPALIAGYIATVIVFWALPAMVAQKLPPRSRPQTPGDGPGDGR